MKINIPYETFWNLTPCEFRIMFDAFNENYKEKKKDENFMLWLNGQYFSSALSATVCNMFRKKGSEPNKYFEKPIPIFEDKKELTAEDKKAEEQKLLLALESMQHAFEKGKNNKSVSIDK